MLIRVRQIFNCRVSLKNLLSLWVVIAEKGLKRAVIKYLSVVLIKLFFLKVGSIQKKIGMPVDLPIIKKSGLVKTTVSIFSLVWLMEFSITCLCLGKVKVFSDNSNLKNLLSVQCLHGNGKRSIRARNGGRLYFVYKTVFAVTHCIRKTFHLQQN